MEFLRKNIRLLVWLLLPAYFLVLKNSIRNRHTHILPNGLVIVHAHPIEDKESDKPLNHHKHTKTEIFFFQLLSVDYHDISNLSGFSAFNNLLVRVIRPFYQQPWIENYLTTRTPRAPPV